MRSAHLSRRLYESVLSLAMVAVIAPLAAGAAGNSPNAADPAGSGDATEARVVLAPNSAFEQEVRSADGALIEAIADNDALAAASLLSSEFAWIDRDGRSRTKSDVVNRIVLLSAGPDTNMRLRIYGRLALLTGRHLLSPDNAPAFFARVWIRQPSGWRLLLYQETAAADFSAKNARYGISRARWPAGCDNPCRSLPYKPLSSEAQEIVAAFMADQKASYDGDAAAERWILGDDVLFVTPDRPRPMHKEERLAEMDNFVHALPADPPPAVASMALWAFGNAAVMSADEESLSGQKLCTTRVWTRRDGRWQLTFSQQTVVQ